MGLNREFREGLSSRGLLQRDQIEEGKMQSPRGELQTEDSRYKVPGVGACLMCPRNREGLILLQQRVQGEEARGRGGSEARVGTLAFTLGELEAIGGLGHWGGIVRLFPDCSDCCVQNRLGTRTGR